MLKVLPQLDFKDPWEIHDDSDHDDGHDVMDEDLAPGVGAGVGVVVLDGVSEKSSAKLLSMFGQLQNCKGKYIACLFVTGQL